jgi:hypothetical protein
MFLVEKQALTYYYCVVSWSVIIFGPLDQFFLLILNLKLNI